MKTIFLCIVTILTVSVGCMSETVQSSSESDFLVVGYLLTYNANKVNDIMADQLTDIIYFSVEPSANGMVDTSRIVQADLDHLLLLKKKHGFRLLLAVGGWGRCKHFASISVDLFLRKQFISNLHQLCLEHKFDGIDFDWEFPGNDQQKQAYNKLIVETSQAVKQDGMIVTCALSPWQKLSDEAYQALDRVHIMAYDQGKRHSTYETAVKSVDTFIQQGIERTKLCMGLPFYGRKIDDTSESITYRQLVDKYHPKADIDEVGGYYFNGQATIKKKTSYCRDKNIGGVMIWEIGQDGSDEFSLLKVIDSFRDKNKPNPDR